MSSFDDFPPVTPISGTDDALVLGDLELTRADLNGHSIDELADYFDSGMVPADPSIDESAGCQIALAAISRLRALTTQLATDDAAAASSLDDGWVASIVNQISLQARAGRDIPLVAPVIDGAEADVVITEGAVRAIVRGAGDRVDGLLIGRCRFVGDVTVPGEPVIVEVDASVVWGHNIRQAADAVRESIFAELAHHTRLNVVAVNVTVHDVAVNDRVVPPLPDLPIEDGSAHA